LTHRISQPTPEEYTPPATTLDMLYAQHDIERSECVYVQEASTGLVARVFGQPISGFCMIVIQSVDELNQVLDLITSIKGRHEHSGKWATDSPGLYVNQT
jgi:hypothetical protein